MSAASILLYCRRAFLFALPAAAFAMALTVMFAKRLPPRKRMILIGLFAFYLAALIQITVVRGGVPEWARLIGAQREFHLTPVTRTLRLIKGGAWLFLYNVAGNILWFVPFGLLAPALFARMRALWRTALSAMLLSCAIELAQYLLLTGVADIDDVILNLTGGAAGYMIWFFWTKRKAVTRRGR